MPAYSVSGSAAAPGASPQMVCRLAGARHFGQRLPAVPGIRAAVNVNAPDRMVRGGVAGAAVARIEEGALDLVPGQMRPLDVPALARVVGTRDEQPLAGADQQRHAA